MKGKHIGFLISGPLSQIPDLKQSLEGLYEVMGEGNIVGFITDESGNSVEIDALLQGLAEQLIRFSNDGYAKPPNFLVLGGRKVIRDDIYGRFRFPFQADHHFFKKHGLYDYPHKNYKSRIRNSIIMLLSRIPFMRRKIYKKRMKALIIKPLQKVLERE